MTARMKKLISIRTIPVLALALLIVLGTALAAGRDPVSGSGSAALNPNTGLLEGSVDLTIVGEEFEDIPFAVTLLAPLVPNEDGVLHVEATHTFDFGDGNTFTTDGLAYFTPTANSTLVGCRAPLLRFAGQSRAKKVSARYW